MTALSTTDLVRQARQAGYQIITAHQLRSNRWLLMLSAAKDTTILVLIQARPLVTAADVQDLAELARLRPVSQAWLWAYGGAFSPVAQRTLVELCDSRLRLYDALPMAAQAEGEDLVKIGAALRAT